MVRQGEAWLAGMIQRMLRRLEADLEALTPAGIWRVIALSIACIAAVNVFLQPIGLHVQPLYILPLCLAAWRLGLGASLGVALLTALLATGIRVYIYRELSDGLAVLNLAILTLMLSVVACVVSSFRFRYERERDHASIDRLTGALNRQAFTDRSDIMLAAAFAQNRVLVLAFIDLDGFKAVNDTLGHHEGDRVLAQFAEGAKRELRGVDCFGRLGGDEFAVLAPAETVEAAQRLAGYLHRRFADVLAVTGQTVTCSMGAVVVPVKVKRSCAELLREADGLMYVAKRSGRNGVRLQVAGVMEVHPSRMRDRATNAVVARATHGHVT